MGCMNVEFVLTLCAFISCFCTAHWHLLSCSSSSAYKHVNVPRAKQLFSLVSSSTAKQPRSPEQGACAVPAHEMGEVRAHSPVVVFGSSFLHPAESRARSQHPNSRGCLLLVSSSVDVLFPKSWGLQIPADMQELLGSLSCSYKQGLWLMPEANVIWNLGIIHFSSLFQARQIKPKWHHVKQQFMLEVGLLKYKNQKHFFLGHMVCPCTNRNHAQPAFFPVLCWSEALCTAGLSSHSLVWEPIIASDLINYMLLYLWICISSFLLDGGTCI